MQLHYIADFLKECGHQVCFYTMDYMPHRPAREDIGGFTVYRNHSMPNGPWMIRKQMRRLRGIIQQVLPDVLFARSLRSVYALYRVSQECEVPFVYQLPCLFEENWYSLRTTLVNLRKARWNFFNAWLAPRHFWKADRVLTVSRDDAIRVAERFAVQVKAIHNMHPSPLPRIRTLSKGFRVVWLNNLKRLKRPEMFVELARRLRDTRAIFVMGGAISDDSYGRRLQREIKATPNLQYSGPLSFDDGNRLLSQANVAVITSQEEGFSNVSIQSWLREVPVVTTMDKDRIIANHRIGFAVSTMDELEKRVRFYLESPEEAVADGRRARQYAVEHHSIACQGPMYLEVFEGVARRRQCVKTECQCREDASQAAAVQTASSHV